MKGCRAEAFSIERIDFTVIEYRYIKKMTPTWRHLLVSFFVDYVAEIVSYVIPIAG